MTIAGAFQPSKRPAPLVGNKQRPWPASDEPCPCGSTRLANDCHFNAATGRWQLPSFQPLLTGPRTGFPVAGCYAASTNDCKGTLSNEHWLSKGILVGASDGKMVRIGGLPWQPPGRIDDLPPSSLGSNILCERHNNALSPLDDESAYSLKILDDYYIDVFSQQGIGGSQLDLVSGEKLERWLLKMIWGASAAFPTVPPIRAKADREMLADYLFREGELPPNWGLYIKGLLDGTPSTPEQALSVQFDDIDGEIWGGSVVVGGVELYFSFGELTAGGGGLVVYRPGAIVLDRDGSDNYKLLALSWDRNITSKTNLSRITCDPIRQGP